MGETKQFYPCAICGFYHPIEWNGDCRDDENRFLADDLDKLYGELGWKDVDLNEQV